MQNCDAPLRSREGIGSQGQRIIQSKRNSSQQQKINDPFLQTAFLIHETIKMSNHQQSSNFTLQPYNTEQSAKISSRNINRNQTSSEETHSLSSGRQTPDFRSTLSRNQIYRKPSLYSGQSTSNYLTNDSPIQPTIQTYNNTLQNFNGGQLSPQSTTIYGSQNGVSGYDIQPKKLFSPQESKQQIPNIFGGADNNKFPKLKPINVNKKISRQQMLRKLQKQLSQTELQNSLSVLGSEQQQSTFYNQSIYQQNLIQDQESSNYPLQVNPFSGQSQRSNHQQNQNYRNYENNDDVYQDKLKQNKFQTKQQHFQNEYAKIFQKQKPLQLQDWTNNQVYEQNENTANLESQNQINTAQSFRASVRSPTLTVEPLSRGGDSREHQQKRQKSGSALNNSIQQSNTNLNTERHTQINQNSLTLQKSKQLSKSQSQARISQHQVFQDRYGVKDQGIENVYNYYDNNNQDQEQQQQQQYNKKNESKLKLQNILQQNGNNHIKRRNQVSILEQMTQDNIQSHGYNTQRQYYDENLNMNKLKTTNGSQSARNLQNIIGVNKGYINQIQLPKIDQSANKSRNSVFMYNTQQQQTAISETSNINSKTQLKLNQILKKQDELLRLQQKLMSKEGLRQQSPQAERDDKAQSITYINNFRNKYLTKQQIHQVQNISVTVLDQQQQQYKQNQDYKYAFDNNHSKNTDANYETVQSSQKQNNQNIDLRKGIQSLMIKQFDKLQSAKQSVNISQQKQFTQSPSSQRYDNKQRIHDDDEEIQDINFQPQQVQQQKQQQQKQTVVLAKHQSNNEDFIEEQESQYEDSQDEVAFIDDKQNKLDARNLELFNQSSKSNKRLIEKRDSQTIQDLEKFSQNQPVSSQLMILQQIQQSSYNPTAQIEGIQTNLSSRQQPNQKKQQMLKASSVNKSSRQNQQSPTKSNQKPIEVDEAYSQNPIAQPLYKVMSSQVIRNAIIHEDDAESVLSSRLASRQ